MSDDMKSILIDLAIIVVVLLIALPFAVRSCEPKVEEVQRDTVYVYDTIRITEPVLVKEEVVRYDTIFFPIVDELESNGELSNGLSNDSANVIIPITERTYEDSTYRAVVRGFKPELVSLDLYRKEVYYPITIEKMVKPKIVVSAGVYGGFGAKGADYGFGISVGVPIWSW